MRGNIAYLSDGKLFLKSDGQPAKLIQSQFVQQMIDRQQRDRQRNSWKDQGQAWKFGVGGMPRQMPMGAGVLNVRFCGLTCGEDGRLIYAIDTQSTGALFEYDRKEDAERRLFHRAEFRARDVSRHATGGELTMSLLAGDGSAHIALLTPDGRGVREITEGDAIDEAPAWVQGDGRRVVYQSAGIGRNGAGLVVGYSPFAICVLDLDRDNHETLLESEAFDYLCPRLLADGTLYYIRRPYRPGGQPPSPLKVALDVVLFPYRLVRAIVHFLDFFSRMFSRKPLITAGGPPKEPTDSRYMMLWGMVIDTESALRKDKGGSGGLVPKTWELIRRSPAGDETTLATGVLSFDLRPDGTVLYTNGTKIFSRPAEGPATEITADRVIERVMWA